MSIKNWQKILTTGPRLVTIPHYKVLDKLCRVAVRLTVMWRCFVWSTTFAVEFYTILNSNQSPIENNENSD